MKKRVWRTPLRVECEFESESDFKVYYGHFGPNFKKTSMGKAWEHVLLEGESPDRDPPSLPSDPCDPFLERPSPVGYANPSWGLGFSRGVGLGFGFGWGILGPTIVLDLGVGSWNSVYVSGKR